jgi:NAD(P)-dependent dehydrogenase (short-subunit alcohol dehydrogenase family)
MTDIAMNKTVVVTGAAGGMGSCLCRLLLERGYRVVGVDHNQARLAELNESFSSPEFLSLCEELVSPTIVQRLEEVLKHESQVWGLVNMAAVSLGDDVANISDDDWEQSLAINLSVPMKLTRLVSQFMKDGGGSIVNISSPVGIIGTRKVSYSASKAGLQGLTMTTARNLGQYKIRCNLLIPGACITFMTKDWSEERREAVGCESFLGRLCTPLEVAKGVAFLLSEESSFMTGSILDMTAGSMVGH